MMSHHPIDRRTMLALGLSAAAVMTHSGASAQTPSFLETALQTIGDGQAFDPGKLLDIARLLAQRPYVAPEDDLPADLGSLTYEQYVSIHARPESLLWRGEGRGFTIEPLHRGFVFATPIRVFAVSDGQSQAIQYNRDHFIFGDITPPEQGRDLGFSGFRVFTDVPGEDRREIAIFQDATFFRAIAKGQTYGIHARTLMLRPADSKGEELPRFRAFWIERPQTGSGALVIHALLDSESVAGVVRFTLRHGDIAITDVEMTLIPRTPLEHIGIGGMTANFLFGEIRPTTNSDTRVAVHDIDGLQIHNGRDEWLWRPVTNPDNLRISSFLDTNPRGFGLLQRKRDFLAFQDDVQRFERRPSLWVEPLQDWGEGSVQLIEVPSNAQANANIIAYWRPKAVLNAGEETSFACRLLWCWSVPDRPDIAFVMGTRIGTLQNGRARRFAVSFRGKLLADAALTATIKPSLSASHGTVSNVQQWFYPDRQFARVLFTLEPGNETGSELRLSLQAGDKTISEAWLFRWTP